MAVNLLEQFRHTNGLTIQRPDGFDASPSADGFVLNEQGSLRSPRSIRIMLLDEPPSKDPKSERRLWNTTIVPFTVDRHSGGSGGEEYELTAWHPVNGKWLVLEAWAQTEGAEPGFTVAWAVYSAASVDGTK